MFDDHLLYLRKALRNPAAVPTAVLGTLLPDSRWGPSWRREDDYVTFEPGGFAGGNPSRSAFSARLYYEVQALRAVLGDAAYDRSLEVGCGYGRVSGWIADYADESVAVDPNKDALGRARRLYPELTFDRALAGDLDHPDDNFDLVVAWTVFTHVPPDEVEASARELARVARPDATIVLCEHTAGDRGRVQWPRSTETYERLFAPYEVTRTRANPRGPTYPQDGRMEVFALEQ